MARMKLYRLKQNPFRVLSVLAMTTLTAASALAAPTPAQQAYLKASNTDSNDLFGVVAISGDTLVVGAPDEDSNATGINGNQSNNSATDSGAAYVFVRNGTNWSQQAYLKASNTGAGDYFGVAAAISGDTLVVGAPGESSDAIGVNGNQSNNSAGSSGAAYVFVRNGTNWGQQAYLKASNTGGGDYFGNTVSIFGDTVVVGAASEDSNSPGTNGDQNNNSAFNAGAAYVFVRSGTNWSQQAYLKASNPRANGEFGSCVSISGDTVVVGAEGEASNATGVNGNQSDNSAPYAGAAYVFARNGTNWSQQAYLKASNTGAGDEFGLTLAISGDTVVVGAHHEDSDGIGINGNQNNDAAEDSGAAYIFVRSGTNWSQQAYLKASNAEAGDEFGDQVAVSGETVVVSTGGEGSSATGVNGNQNDNSAAIAGAAYVFVRNGTNWTQQAYLKASNTEAYDEFGARAAVSGDTVVVGAFSESSNATGVNGNQNDNSASASGASYVFTGVGPSISTRTITVTNTADSGPGTLRAALANAADGDTINFLLSTPAMILLTSGELLVSNNVNIVGPGASQLAVAADRSVFPGTRVFHIASNTVVNLSGLTIANGYARLNNGGGILNDHAKLTVSNCTLSGNYASLHGGAIMNDQGLLVLANSTLTGNNSTSYGAAIYNDGQFSTNASLVVSHSTLSDNCAYISGGGLFNNAGSGIASVRIANSTLSANCSGESPTGGDIWNESWSGGSATLQVLNSTLNLSSSIHNTSSGGSAHLEIGSTILSGPNSGELIDGQSGTVTSLGYNLSSNNGGGFLTHATDQINTEPKLGQLQDNGGPTFTHAPLPCSPAIDKGKNFSGSATDQRGVVRTIDYSVVNAFGGDGTDIGALEIAGTPFLCNFGIASNEFGFNVIGISNQIAIVESSTNFANWTPLSTNTLGAAPFYFSDPVPANGSRRFYRARSP
jgi:hypothetical protein